MLEFDCQELISIQTIFVIGEAISLWFETLNSCVRSLLRQRFACQSQQECLGGSASLSVTGRGIWASVVLQGTVRGNSFFCLALPSFREDIC